VHSRDPVRRGRIGWMVLVAVLSWPLLQATEFRPWVLWAPDNGRHTLEFLASFWPLAHDPDFLRLVLRESWRTVAMATAGVSLAWCLAVPLSLLQTHALSVSALTGRMAPWAWGVRACVRALLLVLRSVPELVWALVWVRVVGLGPAAGVLAIALTYAGMLGKVYAEIVESGERHPTQALLRHGSGRLQALLYGLLPSHAGELASYTVYRWECALRSAAVLGFVGAGGLGQELNNALKMFNGAEVATLLLVFMALVWAADRLSAGVRKVLA